MFVKRGGGRGGGGLTAGETAQRRDWEPPERLPPSHSDPSGWVPLTQRAVLWIRASLITEAERERGGRLKRREGRDWGQREGQERMSASSASSVHLRSLRPRLHPHPPSCVPLPPSFTSLQQLASFHPGRERALWWRRLRHQCAFEVRTESLSKLSMNPHPLLSSLPLSHPPLCPPPTHSFSSSLHGLLFNSSPYRLFSFPLLSRSSCPSCLRSFWTGLSVQF